MARSVRLCLSILLLTTAKLTAQNHTPLADSAINFFRVRSAISYCSARWQIAIDSALAIDSTVATLWQWKGMPYFKNGDYAEAFRCYEKAVHYDPVNYLPLRAFMKATFLKDYEGAIEEFLACKENHYGEGLMDHTYDFFLGICYKETGDLAKADSFMSRSVEARRSRLGEDWVHWNDWFYMGMISFDKSDYDNAVVYYDKCLKQYKGYPDALYYKALSMVRTGRKAEARPLFDQAIASIKKGLHSSEDNDFYVNFPNRVFIPDIEATVRSVYP